MEWQGGGGVLLPQEGQTLSGQRRSSASFCSDLSQIASPSVTFQEDKGSSWTSDTQEREEGVTAAEVTQWLELHTSVKQAGTGSSES